MPYKQVGKRVLVWKNGRWIVLSTHKTEDEAKAHVYALRVNVKH